MPGRAGSPHFLIIDQGTSATKCFLFDDRGNPVFTQNIKHALLRPKPNHVECDPLAIANSCKSLIEQSIDFAENHSIKILAMGLAIQRSTFLFWDKKTLQPASPCLSWQDSRAAMIENDFYRFGEPVHAISGIPLSPHFGGLKYYYLSKQLPELQTQLKSGKLWFGSLSAYIVHQLTGSAAIDHTIAGRTQLMNIKALQWDDELCAIFHADKKSLPEIVPSLNRFGLYKNIPLLCVIGDQQSALLGHGKAEENIPAMNFGTSASVLMNTGSQPSPNRLLLNNVLYSDEQQAHYLLEGSINACNSLFYWLEEKLNIPHEQMVWDMRCAQTNTTGILIPGFAGLAAPYWKTGFETIFYQLENASRDEIIRAGMESIGFLVKDILEQMPINKKDAIIPTGGGGSRKPLLQFIADITGLKIGHTAMKDRTAFGVLTLLKQTAGEPFLHAHTEYDRVFSPAMDGSLRKSKVEQWHSALRKAKII